MCNSLRSMLLLPGMALLLALPCTAFSQISISQDDILALIGSPQQVVEVDTSTTPKTVDVGIASGTSQTWNFDAIALNSPLTFNSNFVDPATTPTADDFPDANIVQHLSGEIVFSGLTVPFSIYNYFRVDANGLASVGSASVVTFLGNETTIMSTAALDATPAPLPVTFGQTWTEAFSDTSDNQLTQMRTVNSLSATLTVDAWGTATVGGANVETLRICALDTTISSVFLLSDGSQVSGPDTTISINYTFPTKANGFIAQIGSLPGETNPNFTMATDILRVKEGITTSVDENPGEALPTTFDLLQNYPNPFNPETQIRYTVGAAGPVELAVFDLQGRLVKTLIDQELPVGSHSVRWDGTDTSGAKVASGRYIYRLKAGDEIKSKMMIMVK